MKQALYAAAFSLFLFSSCKKSSTTPAADKNVILATVDGTATKNIDAVASNGLSSFSGNYVLNVTSLSNYPNSIEVEVSSPSPIAKGTYTNTVSSNPFFIFYGASVTNTTKGSGTVTITSIDAANVQGTFSGDVYQGTVKKTITNGSFNVDF